MKKTKKFSDREIEQLESLEKLLSKNYIEGSELEHLMNPLPEAIVWRELVKRLEFDEIKKLKKKDSRLDARAMVKMGYAWVTADGRLEFTWDGADDGKTKSECAVEMLFQTDLTTGKLKPHGYLMAAVEMMLELDSFPHYETECERFEERLKHWESIAKHCCERAENSLPLREHLHKLENHKSRNPEVEFYEMAKSVFLDAEYAADLVRRNPLAHLLASELAEQCSLLRSLLAGSSRDKEVWFMALNAAMNAAKLCDRLEEVVPKGNIERNRQRLSHKGRDYDPFTDLVGNACEACYRRNPERPPYPLEVLNEMLGRTVWFRNRVHIAPLPGSGIVWMPMPKESFYSAKKAWAKFRGVKLDKATRTPKSRQLPEPKETLKDSLSAN